MQQPRILTIAGTDPTGGAGIQADLKAIAAAGGYGMSAITALVAQNTQGVRSIHTPPVSFFTEQLEAVSDDVQIDGIKIGMLGNSAIVDALEAWLNALPYQPLIVVDPVMISTSGHHLIEPAAYARMKEFFKRATFITPNTPELSMLLGQPETTDSASALSYACSLAAELATNVVLKTGHLSGNFVENAVCTPDGQIIRAQAPRVHTQNTHGTGCSLSSALVTRLAMGATIQQALDWVTQWLYDAISHADALEVGKGHGPIDHFYQLRHDAGWFDGNSTC